MRLLLPVLLLTCSVFAQSKQKFEVSLFVNSKLADRYIYIRYQYSACDGGATVDSEYVSSNKVVFKGAICQPVPAQIFIPRKLPSPIVDLISSNPFFEVSDMNFADSYQFFLMPGETIITANNFLDESVISGSSAVLDFELFKKEADSIDSNVIIFYKKALACVKANDIECAKENEAKLYNEESKMREKYLKYAENNPNSPLAFYALKNALPTKVDSPEVYLNLLLKLSAEVKKYPEAIMFRNLFEGALNFHIGMSVPEFCQFDALGNAISFNQYKNKFVLLYFWNSSSSSSLSIHENIFTLWEKYKNYNFTIAAIGLETLESKDRWMKLIKQYKTPWSQLTDFRGMYNKAAQQFGVLNLPCYILINQGGQIIFKDSSMKKIDQVLSGAMK